MVLNWLWGDLTTINRIRLALLSVAGFFLMVAIWLAHCLSDAFGINAFGTHNSSLKLYGLFCLLGLSIVYIILAGLRNKAKLFFLVTGFYGIVFTITAILFALPTSCNTDKITAALFFLASNSLSTIVVALFWSMVIHTSTLELARNGYHIIIAALLLGSFVAPIPARFAEQIGIMQLLCFIPICIGIVMLVMKYFLDQFYASRTSTKAVITGSNAIGYLTAIGAIIIFSSCALQALKPSMAIILQRAHAVFSAEGSTQPTEMVRWFGLYGTTITIGAMLFALFCSRFFIKRFSSTANLLIAPVVASASLLCLWRFPQAIVFTIAASVVTLILNQTLNTQILTMFFISTSTNAQFRIRALIMLSIPFITNTFVLFIENQNRLTAYTFMALIAWIFAIVYLGRQIRIIEQNNIEIL